MIQNSSLSDLCVLKRELKPIPTIHNNELQKLYDERPSLLPTQIKVRKEPNNRNIPIPDELKQFLGADMVDNFDQLDETKSPNGFSYKKFYDLVLYYRFYLRYSTPHSESIQINRDLHVKLFLMIM